MFSTSRFKSIVALIGGLFLLLAFTGVASANHSWGNYHWARTANPFTLKLGDNVGATWDTYLGTASSDWSLSYVLDTVIVPGLVNPKVCKSTPGRTEVCNSKYGNNGWLGLAQIWVNGDHITAGVTKLNDTYFNTTKYDTPAWRQLVVCQEIGHTFGLAHQDEIFTNQNLGTCMDYTNDPASNQHPNQHDYDELEAIYAHLDTTTTLGQTTLSARGQSSTVGADSDNFEDVSEWGTAIRRGGDGRDSLYERDLGHGKKVFTFVIWAHENSDK